MVQLNNNNTINATDEMSAAVVVVAEQPLYRKTLEMIMSAR
jgi:hypothetical protein